MIQTKKSEPKNESDRSNLTNDDKNQRRDRQDKVQNQQIQKKRKQKTNEFGLDEFECEEVIDVPLKSARQVSKDLASEQRSRYEPKDNPTVLKNPCKQHINSGIQYVRNERNIDGEIK